MIKQFIVLLILSVTCCIPGKAQATRSFFYEGLLDNKPVSLYLTAQPSACGGDKDLYLGIYRYKTKERWIQLNIATDYKGHFSLTEQGFTGTMILTRTARGMEGIWISPDGGRQLKIKLSQRDLSLKEKEGLDNTLEKTNYENNDC